MFRNLFAVRSDIRDIMIIAAGYKRTKLTCYRARTSAAHLHRLILVFHFDYCVAVITARLAERDNSDFYIEKPVPTTFTKIGTMPLIERGNRRRFAKYAIFQIVSICCVRPFVKLLPSCIICRRRGISQLQSMASINKEL